MILAFFGDCYTFIWLLSPISDLPPSRLKKSSAALLKFPAYLSKLKPQSRPRLGEILDLDAGASPEDLGVSNYESKMLQQKLGHVNSKLYDNGEDKARMKETLSERSLKRLSRNFYPITSIFSR